MTDPVTPFRRPSYGQYMMGNLRPVRPLPVPGSTATMAPVELESTYSGSNVGSSLSRTQFPAITGTGMNQPTSLVQRFLQSGIPGRAAEVAGKLSPFMSNIANSFRKPPMPRKGQPYQHTTLNKVNLSDERHRVSSIYAAGNKAAERTVDGNTAEAIKAFNRGDEISRLSAINERETNTNVAIGNQQAQLDWQTSAANTGLSNKYQDELVERDIAHQREQSANWANAGDKLMMIRNENSKRDTELGKARILRSLYDKSGVLNRRLWEEQGLPDPFEEDYKWKGKYGGRIPKRKITY